MTSEEAQKERRKEYKRKWAAALSPEHRRAAYCKWRDADPRNLLLAGARTRAKELGLEFNLTKEDLQVPDVCPALGIPLVPGRTKLHANSPSLDRIDPAKGYISGNVMVISWRANTLKNNANADELRKIADYIDKYLRLN